MENNITIEKMTLEDLDSISLILETEFDDFWNYNILKSELQNSNSIYLVCKIASEIVGFAGITVILDTAELNNIVIKKSYRGNGLSSILLEQLINEAKNRNCLKLNLEVSILNTIAINLYKKFNFVQVGLRKKYYNGQEDALLYTKNLLISKKSYIKI
jgi:ribosomal-protein-alanine N-acetyltransferase